MVTIITIRVNHLAFALSEQTGLTNYGCTLAFPKRAADYHTESKWVMMLSVHRKAVSKVRIRSNTYVLVIKARAQQVALVKVQ